MERAVSQTVSESRPPGLSDSWWTGYDIQIRSHRDCRRHRAALPLRAAVCTKLHALSAVHFSDLHLSHIVQIVRSVQSQSEKPRATGQKLLPPFCCYVCVSADLVMGGGGGTKSSALVVGGGLQFISVPPPFTITWNVFHSVTPGWAPSFIWQ